MAVSAVLSEAEVKSVLDRLCRQLGFCLPPSEQATLMSGPPRDVNAFTDAVFRAEGLDPTGADRHLWRQVRDVVAQAYQAHNDRGPL